uniref:AA_permease domain-containing protein n=1 Tax=Macrostomum lignano TaxID=282301 RepID=A0A1I8FP77_9PLAT
TGDSAVGAACSLPLSTPSTFLLLDKYGLRRLEAFFGFLILTMAVTFGLRVPCVCSPTSGRCCAAWVVAGVPRLRGPFSCCRRWAPSERALVQSRDVNRQDRRAVREANKYFFVESPSLCSCLSHQPVRGVRCSPQGYTARAGHECHLQLLQLQQAGYGHLTGRRLPRLPVRPWPACTSGRGHPGCAGQSSTMTGTYAGQFVMEGFLQLRFGSAAAGAASLVLLGHRPHRPAGRPHRHQPAHRALNDLLNVLMSQQLPFALIPILTFTASGRYMSEFPQPPCHQPAGCACSLGRRGGINVFFMAVFVQQLPQVWYVLAPLGLACLLYFCFIIYLVVLACAGDFPSLLGGRPGIRCRGRGGSSCSPAVGDFRDCGAAAGRQ